MARPVKTNKVKRKSLVCNVCGKDRAITNYYTSNREEYKDYDGYCTTCKDCLKKATVDFNINQVTPEKIRSVLYKLDRPLIQSLFVQVANNDNVTNDNFLGKYISALNLSKDYKTSVYADTVEFELKEEQIKNMKVEKQEEASVTDSMKRFWGRGLENQDYIDLQSMYDEYTSVDKSMSKKKQEDYKNLCIYELQKSKIHFDLSRIADVQKLQTLIDNLSSSLGIQAVQKQDDDKNERFTLGLLARYHEDVKKKPIRRFVEDLGGIDPIQKKIEIYYKGGILQAMGIANPDIDKYKAEVEQYTVKLKEIEAEIKAEKEAELNQENGDIDG